MEIYDFSVRFSGFEAPLRFSWKLRSDRQSTLQTAYRLVIDGLYDSGKVLSRESAFVRVAAELAPLAQYACRVEVWDNHGQNACAEMKLCTPVRQFRASFIAPQTDNMPQSFTASHAFCLKKKPVRAVLTATALGLYEAYLNGEKVGDSYFAPYWTDYRATLQYQSYDVTAFLRETNELAFMVGKGWYCGRVGFRGRDKFYGEHPAVACELHVFYEDGEEVIATSPAWNITENEVTENDLFDGETQDVVRVPHTFSAVEVSVDRAILVPQKSASVRCVQRIAPVRMFTTPKGEHVVDFGVNLTGWVECNVDGERGQTVIIRHAEVLDREGNFYTENLRRAKATDRYTLRGGAQTLRPHFTFHGFRYISVEGLDTEKAAFTACMLSSDLPPAGGVKTSDRSLNRLIENIERSQRDNFLDVPTDCPQRDERCGWTADANVFARTAAYQYRTDVFFEKWLDDLYAGMREGNVPYVVPDVDGKQGTAALWSSAVVMIPHTMYMMYGDKTFLEQAFPHMTAYAKAVMTRMDGGLIRSGFEYGDWLALDRDELMPKTGPGSTDVYFLADLFFNHCLSIIAESASALGDSVSEETYRKLREEHLAAIRREYVTPAGRLVSETQTACVLALKFGIVPKQQRERAVSSLMENLSVHGGHLTTGFAGTPCLLPVLSENGQHDAAMRLLLSHSYPGWLYAVDRGATTVWERWNAILPDGSFSDPSMNSFNHYAYGSVGEFVYRCIAGIDCGAPGFSHILLRPKFSKGLTHVSAWHESVYGKISCGYRAKGGEAEIDAEIPPNTSATLVLPDGTTHELGSGRYRFCVACPDLSPVFLTKDTKVGDILDDWQMLSVCNAVSGNLFASARIAAVREMTLRDTARLMGASGGPIIDGIIERVNALLRAQNEETTEVV